MPGYPSAEVKRSNEASSTDSSMMSTTELVVTSHSSPSALLVLPRDTGGAMEVRHHGAALLPRVDAVLTQQRDIAPPTSDQLSQQHVSWSSESSNRNNNDQFAESTSSMGPFLDPFLTSCNKDDPCGDHDEQEQFFDHDNVDFAQPLITRQVQDEITERICSYYAKNNHAINHNVIPSFSLGLTMIQKTVKRAELLEILDCVLNLLDDEDRARGEDSTSDVDLTGGGLTIVYD